MTTVAVMIPVLSTLQIASLIVLLHNKIWHINFLFYTFQFINIL